MMKLRVFSMLFVVVFAGFLAVVTVAELPPYGTLDNPANNEVTQHYIEDSLEETGVLNMITAIVLDYRAYDTMFETIVLFTAGYAILITLRASGEETGNEDKNVSNAEQEASQLA